MSGRRTTPVVPVITALVVLAGALVAGVVAADRSADPRPPVGRLAALAPASTLALNLTDWAQLRAAYADGLALRTDAQRAVLTAAAQAGDTGTRSVIGVSARAVDDLVGWAPWTIDWEGYLQLPEGGALIVALPAAQTPEALGQRLTSAGYTQGEDLAGAARYSVDLPVLTERGIEGAEVFTQVAVLADQRLAVLASSVDAVRAVLRAATGQTRSLAADRTAAGVLTPLREAATLLLQRGEAACSSADPGSAGPEVRAQADAALARAGALQAYQWAARGITGVAPEQPGRLVLSFGFRTAGLAGQQAEVRSRLTTGPLLGRSGQLEDSLVDPVVRQRGTTATIDFTRTADATGFMSATAPLLIAACR